MSISCSPAGDRAVGVHGPSTEKKEEAMKRTTTPISSLCCIPPARLTERSLIGERLGPRLGNRADPRQQEEATHALCGHPCSYMSIDSSAATYPRSYRPFQGCLTPQTWLGCRAENDEMLPRAVRASPCVLFLLSELGRALHLLAEGGTAATRSAHSCDESMMGN